MIKQIQLRGISRTPSDRMSEDGGLSESLNMYLDTAESAPTLVPNDVTAKLGLPADLQAERIFIHKTANYENYIAVQSDRVVAYTPGIDDDEPLLILELEEGEKVNDITSVGNTLIVSSSMNMYYILYKERNYSFLGNKIHFPTISFYTKNEKQVIKQYKKEWDRYLKVSIPFSEREPDGEPKDPQTPLDFGPNGKFYPSDLGVFAFYDIDINQWNKKNDRGENEDALAKTFLEEREKLVREIFLENKAAAPFFIRYSIELYDGSELSSIPYVFYPTKVSDTFFDAKLEMLYNISNDLYVVNLNGFNLITLFSSNTQTIGIKFEDEGIISSWLDVVKKIKFYISPPLPWDEVPMSSEMGVPSPTYKEIVKGSFQQDSSRFSYKKALSQQSHISFNLSEDFEDEIMGLSSNVFLVKEVEIFRKNSSPHYSEDYEKLLESGEIDISKYVDASHKEYTQLEVQPRLAGDDMKHYELLASRNSSFNNRVLLLQPFNIISYDHARPSAYSKEDSSKAIDYEFTFLLRTNVEDKVIKKTFYYDDSCRSVYAFLTFPDSRAFKAIVKATDVYTSQIKHGEFEMKPHSYLDCSYYYGGLNVLLSDLCTQSMNDDDKVNNVEQLDNKLLMSEQDNPFFFPIDSRYTFQSKIVGVAVATTALSQGQFGQFPLYVFTEDGIWAMETGADGSFVSQKPLSREVCINPDSICSIDNAVVFVTSKAVMMIQGSQVMNISPYMNGKHYTPNASALNLIKGQEGFAELESAIMDEEPFMTFMKKAKTAYDYAGQRLIFIAEDESYQYVYKLDTQTWHKVAFEGFDLSNPINSYPECLVLGQGNNIIIPNSKIEEYAALCKMTKDSFLLAVTNKTPIIVEDFALDTIGENGEFIIDYVDEHPSTKYEWRLDGVKALPDRSEYQTIAWLLNISIDDVYKIISEDPSAPLRYEVIIQDARYDETIDYLGRFISLVEISSDIGYYVTEVILLPNKDDWYTKKVYSLSTILDVDPNAEEEDKPKTAKGILITRPFDLGEPDVYKTIKAIKIRGDYDKGNVNYLLQGSDDGKIFYTLSSMRGKSWKMFRLFILADLEPTERISWVDIDYEPRFKNRLR